MVNEYEKDIYRRLGKYLLKARKERGISQRRLAKMVGISYQTIMNYEKAITKPSRSKLRTLITALDLNIDELEESDPELQEFIRDQIKRLIQEEDKGKEITPENTYYEMRKAHDARNKANDLSAQFMLNQQFNVDSWISIPIFKTVTREKEEIVYKDMIGKTKVPTEWCYDRVAYFGLTVTDNRNYPMFMKGDLVIVQERKSGTFYAPKNDDFIVFFLNSDEPKIGQYFVDNNIITIKYVNENEYREHEVSVFDKFETIGIIKQLRRNFG